MKRSLSILFVFLFMLQSTSKLWIMTSFYVQREYIIDNLCENRFEPITVCGGVCYLDKKLEESNQEEQKIPNYNEKEVTFFCSEVNIVKIDHHFSLSQKHVYASHNPSINTGYIHTLFHPPKA